MWTVGCKKPIGHASDLDFVGHWWTSMRGGPCTRWTLTRSNSAATPWVLLGQHRVLVHTLAISTLLPFLGQNSSDPHDRGVTLDFEQLLKSGKASTGAVHSFSLMIEKLQLAAALDWIFPSSCTRCSVPWYCWNFERTSCRRLPNCGNFSLHQHFPHMNHVILRAATVYKNIVEINNDKFPNERLQYLVH